MLVTCTNIFIATSKLVLDQGIGHQSLTILIDESITGPIAIIWSQELHKEMMKNTFKHIIDLGIV